MKVLKTKNGNPFVIDDQDFEWARKHEWFLRRIGSGKPIIVREEPREGTYPSGKRKFRRYALHRELLGATNTDRVQFKNKNHLDCRRENLSVSKVRDPYTARYGAKKPEAPAMTRQERQAKLREEFASDDLVYVRGHYRQGQWVPEGVRVKAKKRKSTRKHAPKSRTPVAKATVAKAHEPAVDTKELARELTSVIADTIEARVRAEYEAKWFAWRANQRRRSGLSGMWHRLFG